MPLIDLPLEQLKVYKPPLTRRSDFKELWEKNLKLSNDHPLNPVLREVDYPIKKIETYMLTFDGFLDRTPIVCWYLKPVGEAFPSPAGISRLWLAQGNHLGPPRLGSSGNRRDGN